MVATDHRRRLLRAGVVCALGLLIASCGGDSEANTPTASAESASPATTTATAATAAVIASPIANAPTPDADGLYRDLSAEQAQAIVPFALVWPTDVPEPPALNGIQVAESPPTPAGDRGYRVISFYSGASPTRTYQYLQSNRSPASVPRPDATPTEIGDTSVSMTTQNRPDGSAVVSWEWTADDIFRQVVVSAHDDNDIDAGTALVRGIIEADAQPS
ncbi:MAG: hypothetical protein M9890_06040 [Thermomicrobiales bacterium]|nr:hypothetical protein [Thermomicrobiales bacterium]